MIGGGAAGLDAALVLGRARRRTLVLDAGGQSNRAAGHVGGLLGHDGMAPAELYAKAAAQLEPYDSVELRHATATDVRRDGDAFVAGGERAAVLLVATGIDYEVPEPFRALWGRSVFHCPFCEGWEQRDRRVAVIVGEAGDHQVTLLGGWTDTVLRVEERDVEGPALEDGELRGLTLRDGSTLACDVVFLAPALRPRTAALAPLGLELGESGMVVVDEFGRTSVPGVYAAGDVAGAPQQVVAAAASGHMTAIAIIRDLYF